MQNGGEIVKCIPQNMQDVKEILLNQMALIKQKSENYSDLAELSHALVEVAYCYEKITNG